MNNSMKKAIYNKTKIATMVEEEMFGTAYKVCIDQGWKYIYNFFLNMSILMFVNKSS